MLLNLKSSCIIRVYLFKLLPGENSGLKNKVLKNSIRLPCFVYFTDQISHDETCETQLYYLPDLNLASGNKFDN